VAQKGAITAQKAENSRMKQLGGKVKKVTEGVDAPSAVV
jgi:hypothetical protein